MPSLLPNEGKALVCDQPVGQQSEPSNKTSTSREGRKGIFKVIAVSRIDRWVAV
jgi:hypothetical protein